VAEVADDLDCDGHTVSRAVTDYGLALVEDPGRIGTATTLGSDGTAFVRPVRTGTGGGPLSSLATSSCSTLV
jgi:hypothetical protein